MSKDIKTMKLSAKTTKFSLPEFACPVCKEIVIASYPKHNAWEDEYCGCEVLKCRSYIMPDKHGLLSKIKFEINVDGLQITREEYKCKDGGFEVETTVRANAPRDELYADPIWNSLVSLLISQVDPESEDRHPPVLTSGSIELKL